MISNDALALQVVGFPEEFVRAVDAKYADDARNDFDLYVRRTLTFNQQWGGRYNPPCEFGALYTASDEQTAWAELHARFERESVPGLPPTMGLVRLVVRSGRYLDFDDDQTAEGWGIVAGTLQAEALTAEQREVCWQLGRDVRFVADFLRAPSARADGDNIPLFVAGRDETELRFDFLASDSRRATPEDLRQRPSETWDGAEP